MLTFNQFIGELTATKTVATWRNRPLRLELEHGNLVTAINKGGETHTLTPVAEFGGGIVPILNTLSGNLVVAPECNPATITFIPAGGTAPVTIKAKNQKLMCCIHPWMRTVVTRDRDEIAD